jgi:NAD(P)-dependent dehydrogenase (short-subunit alcohol dehydrogenase family)
MGTGWLAGRTGVVTGASRGIGRGVAEALARAGMHVVCVSRDGAALDAVVARIADSGNTATAVVADVSRVEDVERIFEITDDADVLVCAAGILEKASIADTTPDVWSRTIATNLTGTFLCCRAAFTSMRERGGGRIVTFGSLSGVYATEKFPGLAAYNVSKYGVVGLTEMLAVEGRDHHISAVCVSPGAVDTEMLRAAAPHLNPGLVPDDVGRLVVALLDADLAPLSGANIPLFSNR